MANQIVGRTRNIADVDAEGHLLTAPLGSSFGMDVARGLVPNFSIIHKFGRSPSGTNGAWEDIWVATGVYAWPTVASTLEVISTAAADSASGAGAQRILVEGLDADFKPITEIILTNGTSASSATTQKFLRVNRAYVAQAGAYSTTTAGGNTGAVTVRISGAGATQVTIGDNSTTGMGQTAVARYTVPRGHRIYLLTANVNVDANKTAEVALFNRPNADSVVAPFEGAKRMVLHVDGVIGNLQIDFGDAPAVFEAKTDLWWAFKAGAATTACSVDFPFYLEELI